MDAFWIETFTSCHAKQCAKDMAANFGGTRHTGYPEMISAACNFNIEAAFDLSQVLVELPAKIGETAVVSGLQDEFLGYLYGVQGWAVRPLWIINSICRPVRLLSLDYIDTC